MILMEDYNKWKRTKFEGIDEDRDEFSIFYQERSEGQNFIQMLSDIAYELYMIQEVVEGILADIDQEWN